VTPAETIDQAVRWVVLHRNRTESELRDSLNGRTEVGKLRYLQEQMVKHRKQPRALMQWVADAIKELEAPPEPVEAVQIEAEDDWVF
jgi:hypothetical protein